MEGMEPRRGEAEAEAGEEAEAGVERNGTREREDG